MAILPSACEWPLHDAAATRSIETQAQIGLAHHELMGRAGLSTARLARALVPHAARIVVLAGPGNNGSDGLLAARHLAHWGYQVQVVRVGHVANASMEALWGPVSKQPAGLEISEQLPDQLDADLVLDALIGLGIRQAAPGDVAAAIAAIGRSGATVLSVDLPSGLHPDNGQPVGGVAVYADHTLSLLTLKLGLFTGAGRDHAGQIWFDPLGADVHSPGAGARLSGPGLLDESLPPRKHIQHKGSFGDVLVIGGASGMSGAAWLAARAAHAAGAGRVMVCLLSAPEVSVLDPVCPELMTRSLTQATARDQLAGCTVVIGCGGATAVIDALVPALQHAPRLVIDADALNALATESAMRARLRQRAARGMSTVLTPHPLEAARLLGTSAEVVQRDRIAAAQRLANDLCCTVVLKGSGSIVAAAGSIPWINPTGNARLASAGTGDVLAGWLGGLWAQAPTAAGQRLAAAAVWSHGEAAHSRTQAGPMRASDLIHVLAHRTRGH